MAPDDPFVPLIPRESLFWNGYPLFHVSRFAKDFSGRLYFVLGQGLGDHVNGFRILHELQTRYPKARFIVYADRRWEELVLRMGKIDVRWYPTALDPRSGTGTNDPYAGAHEAIREEMAAHPEEAYLAYDHFPMPDRHARGETTLEAISRAIGVDFRGEARPFLPFNEADGAFADRFLREKGLEGEKFALLAPFSWPNKRWSRERFSLLIDDLYKIHGLRSLLVAYPELGAFDNPGVVMAYDLTLGQIGGLISRATLFVGLDSGPSHMAAALELPMVVIFVERKTIPFEVRALSPWALHVVEGFARKEREPSLETVSAAVSFVLKNRANLKRAIPRCPACERPAHYVWATDEISIDFGCVCGLVIRETRPDHPVSDNTFLEGVIPTDEKMRPEGKIPLSKIFVKSDLGSLRKLRAVDESLRQSRFESLELTFERGSGGENCALPVIDLKEIGEIRWSQDALVYWMGNRGYDLWEVPLSNRDGDQWTLKFVRREKGHQGRGEKPVKIPWGNVILRLASPKDYGRWFTFEKWGRPVDLVGIVKSQVALGYYKEATRSARVAFWAKPSVRSLRWVGKAFYFRLIRRGLP
jgi:ADP-heptose:LPS heptosyltransferase